jgi:hypothetical protein
MDHLLLPSGDVFWVELGEVIATEAPSCGLWDGAPVGQLFELPMRGGHSSN